MNIKFLLDKIKYPSTSSIIYFSGAIFAVLLVALYLTFPSDVRTEILKTFYLTSGVFLVYPVTFLIIRKIFRIYYDRQLKSAEDIIKQTRVEKKEILETVMEKEPYNKAKEILKKYDPSLLKSEEQKKEEEEVNFLLKQLFIDQKISKIIPG